MKRFDTIEAQNQEQLDVISAHISDYNKVAKSVERHGVYFKLMGGGVGFLAAAVAAKLGWK